jgi:hypothetical protein
VRLANTYGVVIADNEFTDIRENGNHTDGVQSVWGSGDVTIRDNWFHGNRSQLIFFKDGRVSGATIEDNLFTNNDVSCIETCSSGAPIPVQAYDTTGLVVRGNTMWDNVGGFMLRSGIAGALVDHNVLQTPSVTEGATMTEDDNVIGGASGFTPGTHDLRTSTPGWMGTGDYRLAASVTRNGATYAAGVDWRPADKHFGP